MCNKYVMSVANLSLPFIIGLLFSSQAFGAEQSVTKGPEHGYDVPAGKIRCVPELGYKCTTESCQRIEIITVYTSQYLEIDTDKNTLTGSIDGHVIDIEHIRNDETSEDAYVFYGTHRDLPKVYNWVFRIDKKTRKMVVTSVSDETSDTVFGMCHWDGEK